MHACSSPVSTSQTGIHAKLHALVARHVAHPFHKPVAAYSKTAFDDSIMRWRDAGCLPLILDAGCGVGLSTLHLATRYPDHFVIGVDCSQSRIERNTRWHMPLPDNLAWVRADLVDYWRQLLENRIFPAKQYLLYPNPWPKIGHLARRWHGHAIFPTLVALGGLVECRSNWRIYIEEFAAAMTQCSGMNTQVEAWCPHTTITPFEEKYLTSGHALWRCRVPLSPQS